MKLSKDSSKRAAQKRETLKRWRKNNPERLKHYETTRTQASKDAKKLWAKNNPKKIKDLWLRRQYGISIEQYYAMLKEQNNGCAICHKPHEEINGKRLAVDHCHTTGNVRGLLCGSCNKGIGLLRDTPELVGNALSYLGSVYDLSGFDL